jgi:hypothetical protein
MWNERIAPGFGVWCRQQLELGPEWHFLHGIQFNLPSLRPRLRPKQPQLPPMQNSLQSRPPCQTVRRMRMRAGPTAMRPPGMQWHGPAGLSGRAPPSRPAAASPCRRPPLVRPPSGSTDLLTWACRVPGKAGTDWEVRREAAAAQPKAHGGRSGPLGRMRRGPRRPPPFSAPCTRCRSLMQGGLFPVTMRFSEDYPSAAPLCL